MKRPEEVNDALDGLRQVREWNASRLNMPGSEALALLAYVERLEREKEVGDRDYLKLRDHCDREIQRADAAEARVRSAKDVLEGLLERNARPSPSGCSIDTCPSCGGGLVQPVFEDKHALCDSCMLRTVHLALTGSIAEAGA